MRRPILTLTAVLALLGAFGPAAAATPAIAAAPRETAAAPRATAATSPQQRLDRALDRGMADAGDSSGALVVDLTDGRTLYSNAAQAGRLPASVEKLYTTTTVLTRFGAQARLQTRVFATGHSGERGMWVGDLYLRGGGDPTFGSARFDRLNYGGGATVGDLADRLLGRVRVLHGRIVGDESLFDSERGTPPYGGAFNTDVEGSLSALVFDRGVNADWTVPVAHPALYAAQQLIGALHARHVDTTHAAAAAGRTPQGAQLLGSVASPTVANLLALTLTPSDNFFAEMLIKDLGAYFGSGGTTADGAAVVRAQVAQWGLHPRLDDGSGLSYYDRTSPAQVVSLLRRFARAPAFYDALAVAGRSGTLQHRMRGTGAQDRCRGKTGSLHAVSNLAGYCTAADGHLLVFALLMNQVDPSYARDVQDAMVEAIAGYDG